MTSTLASLFSLQRSPRWASISFSFLSFCYTSFFKFIFKFSHFLEVLALNDAYIYNIFQVYDAVALKLCLSTLTPNPEEFDDPPTRLVWCNRILAIRSSAENLLNSSKTYGEKTTFVLRDCRSADFR